MKLRSYHPPGTEEKENIAAFLRELGLSFERDVDTSACVFDGEQLIATGSRKKDILKCIGVDPGRREEGLTGTILSELIMDAKNSGFSHLFLFTEPKNYRFFRGYGFYPIVSTERVTMMENRRGGIDRFVRGLEPKRAAGVVGAIVANCNPFTNGHRYLIERAAKECDSVHLFILSEDESFFSAADRYEMALAGIEDLKNVLVHSTQGYLISKATFPTYFVKEQGLIDEINCELDLLLFAEKIAKPLNITRRYIGTEPYCEVTAAYHREMKSLLSDRGIEVVEVSRMPFGNKAISASEVRRLIEVGEVEKIRKLVPKSTYDYLERILTRG